MKLRLSCYFFIVGHLLAIFFSSTAQQKNGFSTELNRVFHHQSVGQTTTPDAQNPLSHIEFAQVVLYFSQEPIVNKIPRLSQGQKNGDQQMELFFPGAVIKGPGTQELEKKMIDTTTKTPFYTVKLEPTATPIAGVKCLITFNKLQVAFDYDLFLSISAQHAVRLRFFNKKLMNKINKENTLLRVVSNTPRIILDCGHGGTDTGAVGVGRVSEKEVTLSIGLEVASMLREHGYDVYMTRDRDIDMPLDARTSYANAIPRATALVSIHANSSPNPMSCGIETFYVTPSLFKQKEHHLDSCEKVLVDRYQHVLREASQHLANVVHQHVLHKANHQQTTCNRKVKSAAAQVLLGSHIPGTLVEIGFLSNPYEATLLSDKRYQKLLAQGICNGILAYHTMNKLP